MATITEGTVTITFDDSLTPPPEAGKLTAAEVKRLPKAPRGLGLVGDLTANAMENAGTRFVPPAGVTPEALRTACKRADDIDQLIIDIEVALHVAKQANLLFDGDAWEMLRKVNDQLKVQVKHQPELAPMFEALTAFMSRKLRGTKTPEK